MRDKVCRDRNDPSSNDTQTLKIRIGKKEKKTASLLFASKLIHHTASGAQENKENCSLPLALFSLVGGHCVGSNGRGGQQSGLGCKSNLILL